MITEPTGILQTRPPRGTGFTAGRLRERRTCGAYAPAENRIQGVRVIHRVLMRHRVLAIHRVLTVYEALLISAATSSAI